MKNLLRTLTLFSLVISASCSSDTAASGETGTDGTDGTTSTTGTEGTDGTTGTDGSAGTDGTTGTDGSAGTDGTTVTDGPTFHGDIEPLLQSACQTCHRDGSVAPFALTSYEQAAPMAALLADAVKRRDMPPFGVQTTDECEPRHGFREDLRLSDEEIALFEAWAAAGAPQGDPSLAPAPADFPPFGLDRVDASLLPKNGYITQGKQDEFVCFVMDPKLESDVFVQGVHVKPGNLLVAHHALVFTDPNRESLALAGETGYYPCFGDSNVSNTSLLAAWAPGGAPSTLPDNAGMPLSEGTLLVLQMHYHPLGEPADMDVTGIDLKYTTEEPEWHSLVALLGNFEGQDQDGNGLQPGMADTGSVEFRIPAGTDRHIEEMSFVSPAALGGVPNSEHYVYSVAPHMHYLGKRMAAWVDRPEPGTPHCPAEQAGPFSGCLTDNCLDYDGSLEDCIEAKCGAEYSALSGLCEDCLVGWSAATGDATQAFLTCMAPPNFSGPEQPASECLFDSPEYNFEWQRFYVYDSEQANLPIVRPGDTLRWVCEYDNTLANQAVADALQYQGIDEPVDVYLGDTTIDEMCLLVLQTLYKPWKPEAE